MSGNWWTALSWGFAIAIGTFAAERVYEWGRGVFNLLVEIRDLLQRQLPPP